MSARSADVCAQRAHGQLVAERFDEYEQRVVHAANTAHAQHLFAALPTAARVRGDGRDGERDEG